MLKLILFVDSKFSKHSYLILSVNKLEICTQQLDTSVDLTQDNLIPKLVVKKIQNTQIYSISVPECILKA